MKKIVCDANSIIYLTKIDLLKPLVEAARLILPQVVVEECLKQTSIHHEDADLIELLLKKGQIQVVTNKVKNAYPRLGPGETSVLYTFEHLPADMVLTD